jgi:DegV family protein with EDD domain
MDNRIALVTDSTNDLPLELREKYGILVVPLTIVWGGNQYQDGIDLKPDEFYRRLVNDPDSPSTSQPSPADFLKVFKQVEEEGASEIVAVLISSAMSGTIASARSAAKEIGIPVHIVDSKSNSMSLGWQLLACARAREAGADALGMVDAAETVRGQLHYHIVLDTLEYLFRGGRIAGAAKFLGSVLNFKPQIRVNHQTGSVEPGDVSRTRTRAIEVLYTSFFKKLDTSKPLRIAILHNDALTEAEALAKKIIDEYSPVETIIGIVSPVLGSHTGPRAIALCGYSEP